MTYDYIQYAVRDDIARITLNRPQRLNAMPPTMADEISNALNNLGTARVVVISGAGRAFCSGADLAIRADSVTKADSANGGGIKGGKAANGALMQHYNPMMLAIARLDVPLIAAVNGPAAGIGCSLALAADFVLAAHSAYFLQAFVNIGLVPDGGASWTLPRLVGRARASEMMFLGEKIPADKAADWGLIYRAVSDQTLMSTAETLAVRLAQGPTLALGLMKQNITAALDSDYATALHREAETQSRAGDSADAHEGTQAFLAKRAPQFIGR